MKRYARPVLIILVLMMMAVMLSGLAACGETTSAQNQAFSTGTAVPEPDKNLRDDSVIGNWTDIDNSKRFAQITKSDSGYMYEDPEGQYSADFEDGVLNVKVSDIETADVYFDSESGNLICNFNGSVVKFKKQD